MKFSAKDDKFVFKDVTLRELWVLYWALREYSDKNRQTVEARVMADDIYAKKLKELDPGYCTPENTEDIRRRNTGILGQLRGMVPIAGFKPGGY